MKKQMRLKFFKVQMKINKVYIILLSFDSFFIDFYSQLFTFGHDIDQHSIFLDNQNQTTEYSHPQGSIDKSDLSRHNSVSFTPHHKLIVPNNIQADFVSVANSSTTKCTKDIHICCRCKNPIIEYCLFVYPSISFHPIDSLFSYLLSFLLFPT